MAAPKKIDWASAQKDYIQDRTLTYANIAEKYGVSKTVVGQRAANEGWKKTRSGIIKKTISSVEGEIVDRNTRINELHYDLASSMASLANKQLNIAHRQIDKLELERGKHNITLDDKGVLSQHRMKALFEAMTMAINLQRVSLGLPITVERKQVSNRPSKAELFNDEGYDDHIKLLADTLAALEV